MENGNSIEKRMMIGVKHCSMEMSCFSYVGERD